MWVDDWESQCCGPDGGCIALAWAVVVKRKSRKYENAVALRMFSFCGRTDGGLGVFFLKKKAVIHCVHLVNCVLPLNSYQRSLAADVFRLGQPYWPYQH